MDISKYNGNLIILAFVAVSCFIGGWVARDSVMKAGGQVLILGAQKNSLEADVSSLKEKLLECTSKSEQSYEQLRDSSNSIIKEVTTSDDSQSCVPPLKLQTSSDEDKFQLSHVENGVFEMRYGIPVDLTDKNILVTFRRGQSCNEIVINGRSNCVLTGNRFDFKRRVAPFYFGAIFKNKEKCFLEVLGIDEKPESQTTGIFRLQCI